MNFAGFGLGLASAVQGFNDTSGLIQRFRDTRNANAARSAIQDDYKKAEADRQSQITGLVQPQAGADGKVSSYKVGNRTFADQNAAETYAGQQVGSAMDFFNKSYAPKIQDLFMQQGNVDAANHWQQYTQDQQTQSGQRYLARANLARLMGDTNGMVQNMMAAVNSAPGSQGYKITGAQPVTGQDGTITGYNLSVVAPDGSTSTRQIAGGADGIWNLGSAFLSPETQFDQWRAQKMAAAKVAGDAAIENLKGSYAERTAAITGQSRVDTAATRNQGLVAREKIANQGARDRQQLGLANAGASTAGSINAKVDALRQQGYTDDQIKTMMPNLVGGAGASSAGRDPGKTYDTMLDNAEKTNLGGDQIDPASLTDAAIAANKARAAVVAASKVGGGSTGVAAGLPNDGTGTATPAPQVNSTLGLPLYDPNQPDDNGGDN